MFKSNLMNALLTGALPETDTNLQIDVSYYDMIPVPCYLTITPFGQLSTMSNSEIVLVTSTSPTQVTIVRGQKNTTPKKFRVGDIVSNGIYAESTADVGDIVMSLRQTPAVGRLFMDGGRHNKSDYPLLYTFVQNNPTYGTYDTNSFTLTDMRARMPVGFGSNYTLGSTGGFERTRHVNALWGISANAFAQSGTNYLNSLKPLVNQWLTGDGSSSELTHKTSVANVGGPRTQDGSNAIERMWYEYTSSNMPPYIVVNYEVVTG